MAYVRKTLTEGETIIKSISLHWVFWFSPAKFLALSSFLSGIIYFSLAVFIQTSIYLDIFIFSISITSFICTAYYFIEYKTTENVITDKRVILKHGFIRVDTDELINSKIENIQTRQSLLGRILDYGNLEFTGVGGSSVLFKKIPRPMNVKKQIEKTLQNTSSSLLK